MKKAVLLFCVCSYTSLFSQIWLQKAAMPSSRGLDAPISFTINGKMYVGGGYNATNVLDSFYEYDPSANTWTQKANIPQVIFSAGSFALHGKGYIVCGARGSGPYSTAVYQYDPATDTWATKNNFPGSGRQNVLGFSCLGKGYLAGGFNGVVIAEMWEYNDTTDSWTQKANIPGPGRNGPAWLVVNNQIFVGMGANSNGTAIYSDFYRFDPAANTYTIVDSSPVARSSPANYTIGNIGYVGLGYGLSGNLNDFYKYDPVANTWTQTGHFGGTARFGAYNEVVNGVPYIGCGVINGGSYAIDNWSFDHPASVTDIPSNEPLRCYPSPSAKAFTIDMSAFGAGKKGIIICDQLGQIVYQTSSSEKNLMVNQALSEGIYIVSVSDGLQRQTAKMVIE